MSFCHSAMPFSSALGSGCGVPRSSPSRLQPAPARPNRWARCTISAASGPVMPGFRSVEVNRHPHRGKGRVHQPSIGDVLDRLEAFLARLDDVIDHGMITFDEVTAIRNGPLADGRRHR